MNDAFRPARWPAALHVLAAAVALSLPGSFGLAHAQSPTAAIAADYIVAVVNQEPITHTDIDKRVARLRAQGAANLPAEDELRQQVLDSLIDEKVQLQFGKAMNIDVSDTELDSTIDGIAAQNQMTPAQLRDRLKDEGMDYARYRATLKEQLLLQRIRDREVNARIQISDNDIDDFLKLDPSAGGETKVNLAHVLIAVPEKANAMEIQLLRSRALDVQQRAAKGEDFDKLAAEFSDDARTKGQGGSLGLRPVNRLPELFVNAASRLKVGQTTQVLRSNAGFHVIKLLAREEGKEVTYTQQHGAHILLRNTPSATQAELIAKIKKYREQIAAGKVSFEQMARQYSEDGSAARGGDLGWSAPGQFVPEFEKVLNGLQPGQVSEPLVSRFGVHLIKLLERREVPLSEAQKRESARGMLKERRFENTYEEWARDLRAAAWIEIREAP